MELFTSDNAIAFLTLTALEIILGIDNVIFIAILCGKLPKDQQKSARQLGLLLALITRILLLLSISWVMGLTEPLINVEFLRRGFSGRDLILFFGGLFLVGKATYEIHERMEGSDESRPETKIRRPKYVSVLIQIMLIDIVFSLDSVITAVGMAQHVEIMVAAVILAVFVMIIFSGAIAEFIERHPTFKILALSFLILIGVMLVAESLGEHVDKGYIYFAMAFSICVEMLNQKIFSKGQSKPEKQKAHK